MLPVEFNSPAAALRDDGSPAAPSSARFPSFRRLGQQQPQFNSSLSRLTMPSEPMGTESVAAFGPASSTLRPASSFAQRASSYASSRFAAATLEELVDRSRSPVTEAPPPLAPASERPLGLKANPRTSASVRRDGDSVVHDDDDDDASIPPDVRCPVCLDPFDQPVTLTCLHSVCKSHIADLAASRFKKPSDPIAEIVVDCPKCRQASAFDGPSAIRVNAEMQGIVTMMLKLLKREQQASKERQKPDTKQSRQRNRSNSPSRAKAVSFATPDEAVEHGTSRDANLLQRAPPVAPHNKRPGQQGKTFDKLADLEKELQRRREEAQQERERRSREAVEEYKRMRTQELETRMGLLDAVSATSPHGHDIGTANDPLLRTPRCLLPPPPSEGSPGGLDTVGRRLRLHDEMARDHERQLAEEEERRRVIEEERLRSHLRQWITDVDHREFRPEVETKAFEERLRQVIGDAPLSESLQRDAMRRAAEMRLPNHPAPPAAGAVSEGTTALPSMLQRDIEVELRMLEIERIAQRERDDELSRAEMAEIAERRARMDIDRYRRQERATRGWVAPNALVDGVRDRVRPGTSPTAPVAGTGGFKLPIPTYSPKLNRVQRIA